MFLIGAQSKRVLRNQEGENRSKQGYSCKISKGSEGRYILPSSCCEVEEALTSSIDALYRAEIGARTGTHHEGS